jgi:hypothetical protein
VRKPVNAEDLDFTVKMKAIAQGSPKGERMLLALLYAEMPATVRGEVIPGRCRLILINPGDTSTTGAVKYATRRDWSVHATAEGIMARRGQKLTERLPRAGTAVRVPV